MFSNRSQQRAHNLTPRQIALRPELLRQRMVRFDAGLTRCSGTADLDAPLLVSPDNLDENGGGNQTVKRRPVATL